MKWQPIETAPKDGTWFLGYTPRKIHGRKTSENGSIISYRYWSDGSPPYWFSNMNGWPQPTHWMPLPEPPTGEQLYYKPLPTIGNILKTLKKCVSLRLQTGEK